MIAPIAPTNLAPPSFAGRLRRLPRTGGFWIGVVLALIGMNFVIVAITIVAAQRSRTPVEPDYYRRAMEWDSSARQIAMNRSLGWSTTALIKKSESGASELRVRLLDSAHRPIRTAEVFCELFHESDPTTKLSLTLVGGEDGLYAAPAPVHRPGLWRANLACHASAITFTSSDLIEVALSDLQGESR